MPYICHCDICDARIEGESRPHSWTIGEAEQTSSSPLYPPTMLICDTCFPVFQEEVKAFIQRIKRWREQAKG